MELFTMEGLLFLLRWVHFLAGITWIGVLYYFNFIQTPFFGTELGGQARSAMMRGLVPNALWWFRWGAMFTFLSGLTIIAIHLHLGWNSAYLTLIGTGATMGTIMFLNVWVVIWPIQQVAIASAEQVASGGEANPIAAQRAPIAARASRTNTIFTLPMLFFMGSARHLSLVNQESPAYGAYWAVALILIALVELNIFYGSGATRKPLGSVGGTIHAGVGLTLLLFLAATFLL